MHDPVNHPAHYTAFPMEVKDVIRHVLGYDGYKAYCLGNEIKYRFRAGIKDPAKILEDIQKAEFYRKERNTCE